VKNRQIPLLKLLVGLILTGWASLSMAQEEIPPISEEMKTRWAITDGPDDIYLRVLAPLDEWRFYCLDIPGNRDNLDGIQLNVHSCKEGMWHRDTIFSRERTNSGDLFMPEYGLCVEPSSGEAGATVHLGECSGAEKQKWDFSAANVRPMANTDLCLTISETPGVLTSGGLAYPTQFKSREISLEPCSENISDRQGWYKAKPMIDLEAPILPDGASADWRDWVNP
jgi:hypothetical protein